MTHDFNSHDESIHRYFLSLDELKIDTVNRVVDVTKTAGGKGLNVTRVLSEFGDSVVATGLVGGKLGEFLVEHIDTVTSLSLNGEETFRYFIIDMLY